MEKDAAQALACNGSFTDCEFDDAYMELLKGLMCSPKVLLATPIRRMSCLNVGHSNLADV